MEFGSFIPFELNSWKEYYDSSRDDVISLNSGRAAVLYAVMEGGYNSVLLPIYTCPTIEKLLIENGVSCSKYNIDESMLPQIDSVKSSTLVLITNYFGLMSKKIKEYIGHRTNFIVDNTQAFFSKPIEGVYNFYSCRKFFGVADGAYLIKPGEKIGVLNLKMSDSLSTSMFLLKAYENGINANYSGYKENEGRLEKEGMRAMSVFTARMMKSIDYDMARERRRSNFIAYENAFKDRNILKNWLEDGEVPFVYPLLIKQDGLRDYLVGCKIFIPRWWKCVMENEASNEYEILLAKYLLPLPIDQRYDENDIDIIINKIMGYKE